MHFSDPRIDNQALRVALNKKTSQVYRIQYSALRSHWAYSSAIVVLPSSRVPIFLRQFFV